MSSAWETLTKSESDQTWDQFYAKFRFQPSMDSWSWPSIVEPSPSITWKLMDPCTDAEVDEVYEFALKTFRRIVRPTDGWIYALDWQHECFRYRPHLLDGPWRVGALPDGDYSIFLAQDLSSGWFAHPWESTICLFGEAMLAAVGGRTPRMFASIVRQR